jgi:hypothetical protein
MVIYNISIEKYFSKPYLSYACYNIKKHTYEKQIPDITSSISCHSF